MTKVVTVSAEELAEIVERACVKAVTAAQAARPAKPTKPLSLAMLAKQYGVGRRVALADIAAGRLRCTERVCRGGRMGIFVPVAEAERVYG